ncbi:MAG: hypothetical protein Q7T41_03345, partial [Candidatus Saccharibacteria bacterium]|nr:hypothetical protein [Candidatus Saccharibacteria bacterium]
MEDQVTEEPKTDIPADNAKELPNPEPSKKAHNKKYVIISALVLVLIIAGCVWFLTQRKDDSPNTQNS